MSGRRRRAKLPDTPVVKTESRCIGRCCGFFISRVLQIKARSCEMKPEEIAAYIGAAAWLPQIITWLYRGIVRPSVRLVPNQYAEAGFTSLGPIFNLRMAFSV